LNLLLSISNDNDESNKFAILNTEMGFLILESSNNKLSFAIKKNPLTTPHIKELRKGQCIGWFSDDIQDQKMERTFRYIIKFTDIGESVSFTKEHDSEYDYLPYMQYCSPLLVASISKEMFKTAMNQSTEDDITSNTAVIQPIMKLNKRAINFIEKLNKHVSKYVINIKKYDIPDLYHFTLESKSTKLCDILQYAYLISYILQCLTFGYYEKPVNGSLEKILKIMNDLNLPYYIRYLFKIYFINKSEFDKYKTQIQGNNKIIMEYGNTQSQRCSHITNGMISFCKESKLKNKNIKIIDLGCGEGYYIRELVRLLTDKEFKFEYYAHDIDPSEMESIEKLVENNSDYKCVRPISKYDDLVKIINTFKNDDNVFVIFSEVIEHIPLDKIDSFMSGLLELRFNKLMITTPQKEFNKYYMMDEKEFRHPDHKQEFTKQQFVDYIEKLTQNKKLTITYQMIGDKVDGISMSQGYLIQKDI